MTHAKRPLPLNSSKKQSHNLPLLSWPVYGSSFEVLLIGGLYSNELPKWAEDLHGKTLELAVPIPLTNQFLKRLPELCDEAAAQGMPVTATYRRSVIFVFNVYSVVLCELGFASGINIKVCMIYLSVIFWLNIPI